MPLLPPVIATLLADTKEYMAKMTEAQHKMDKFGLSADTAGSKFSKFADKASTAVIGVGAAIAGYGIDQALKFTESLDKIQNQAGVSSGELDYLKTAIMKVSDQTAISSDNISSAFLQVEKAGLRGKAAYQVVDNAAKAAAITGGDVTQMTQTLIGIQNLQIAKGMSVAAVSDLMVKANQSHIGSLESLTGILTGKVGGALAAEGLNLAEMAAVSDVASKAGYSTAKSYTQLATGLHRIENPTKASSKAMAELHINAQTLAETARHPGTGLVDVLSYLEQVSKKTGVSMNTLITQTFGPGAVGLVSTLSTHINTLAKNVKTLGGASGADLAKSFGITQNQLNFRLEQLKNSAKNALTGLGLLLLPGVSDIANWVTNTVAYLQKHPLLKEIASKASIAAFVAAVGFKLFSGIQGVIGKIKGLFGGGSSIPSGISTEQGQTQITLLTAIADNTAIMAGEGGISGTEAAAGALGGAEGGGALAVGAAAAVPIALAAAVFAGGYYATRGNNRDVTPALVEKFYKGATAAAIMKQVKAGEQENQAYVIDQVTGAIFEGGGRGRMVSGWTPATGAGEQTWANGHNITKPPVVVTRHKFKVTK